MDIQYPNECSSINLLNFSNYRMQTFGMKKKKTDCNYFVCGKVNNLAKLLSRSHNASDK